MLVHIASMPSLAVALLVVKLAALGWLLLWAVTHLGLGSPRPAPETIRLKTRARRG